MSSWIADLDRSLIMPRDRNARKRRDVFCKVGEHLVPLDLRMVWLQDPMGLSCVPCVQEKGLEVPEDPKAAPPAGTRVPVPRRPRTSRTRGTQS